MYLLYLIVLANNKEIVSAIISISFFRWSFAPKFTFFSFKEKCSVLIVYRRIELYSY